MHLRSTVYSPSSNGAVERAVQTFKRGVRVFEGEERDIQGKLDRFLCKYRVVPHSTTGISPYEMMFGRRMKTIFDLLHPAQFTYSRVLDKQTKMKSNYNRTKPRKLSLRTGETVRIRNYGKGPKWIEATIQRKCGNVIYECTLPNGVLVKRHVDQIWPIKTETDEFIPVSTGDSNLVRRPDPITAAIPPEPLPQSLDSASEDFSGPSPMVVLPTHSRSGRRIKPPDRLNL